MTDLRGCGQVYKRRGQTGRLFIIINNIKFLVATRKTRLWKHGVHPLIQLIIRSKTRSGRLGL